MGDIACARQWVDYCRRDSILVQQGCSFKPCSGLVWGHQLSSLPLALASAVFRDHHRRAGALASNSHVALAWLTYRLIERPIRFHARALEATLALLAMMVLVGGVGYATFALAGIQARSVVERNVGANVTPAYDSNPSSPSSIPDVSKYVVCDEYAADNSSKKIVIWGDSTAGAWLPVFLESLFGDP